MDTRGGKKTQTGTIRAAWRRRRRKHKIHRAALVTGMPRRAWLSCHLQSGLAMSLIAAIFPAAAIIVRELLLQVSTLLGQDDGAEDRVAAAHRRRMGEARWRCGCSRAAVKFVVVRGG